MAQIRSSRESLIKARGELMSGISRLRVDVNSALAELAQMEATKIAIDNMLDEMDQDERTEMGAR